MNTGLYRKVFTEREAIELFGAHANGLGNMEKCQTFFNFHENYGYDGDIYELEVFVKEYILNFLMLLKTSLLIKN